MRWLRCIEMAVLGSMATLVVGCDTHDDPTPAAGPQGQQTPSTSAAHPRAQEGSGTDTSATADAADGGEAPEEQREPRFDPPDPGDALGQRVHELAAKFAERMVAASPIYAGELQAGRHRDYQAVLKSIHCYRVIAAGGEGVDDVDLKLYDSRSVLMQRDAAADPAPVLGLQEPLCPKYTGMYRVRVEMAEGSGPFRLRIFRTE